MAEFQTALELRPDDAWARNNLAWVLATCPSASIRNGTRAVVLSEQADRLCGGTDPVIVGTLAAAYAETGQFPQAVAAAQRALQLATAQSNATLVEGLRVHLQLYQARSPLRDPGLTNIMAYPDHP